MKTKIFALVVATFLVLVPSLPALASSPQSVLLKANSQTQTKGNDVLDVFQYAIGSPLGGVLWHAEIDGSFTLVLSKNPEYNYLILGPAPQPNCSKYYVAAYTYQQVACNAVPSTNPITGLVDQITWYDTFHLVVCYPVVGCVTTFSHGMIVNAYNDGGGRTVLSYY